MAKEFKIKEGNQRPPLKLQLVRLSDTGSVESIADLSDADTITLTLKSTLSGQVRIEKGTDVEVLGDPEEGNIQYLWQVGDTDIDPADIAEGAKKAKFLAEVDVVYTNGEEETFPNSVEGFPVTITRRLS